MAEAAHDRLERPALTGLVLALLLPPLVAALALRQLQVPRLAWTPYLDLTLLRPLVLAAAAAVFVHWRTTGDASSRRATVALVTAGLPGLVLAGLVLAQPQDLPAHDGRRLLVQVLANLAGVAAGSLDLPARWRFGPMALGCTAGAVVTAASLAFLAEVDTLRLGSSAALLLIAVSVISVTAFAGILLRDGAGSGAAAWGLGTGLTLVTIGGTAVAASTDARGPALTTASVGAVVLAGSALALVSRALHASVREATDLYVRLHDVEQRDREQRARLHEIGSTVAGLVAASRLVTQEPSLSTDRRSALASMVQSESERLERIIRDEEGTPASVALDQLLAPLVLARRARGIQVVTSPSGCRADARPDEVAQVVGVLLDNAAAHSGSELVRLEVRRRHPFVEIVVSDAGRGLPAGLRSRIFDWGVRGPDSTGQGIGLSQARRLARRQGGYLRVEEQSGAGATFVVGLPESARPPLHVPAEGGVRHEAR